jgi:hypothetical protein
VSTINITPISGVGSKSTSLAALAELACSGGVLMEGERPFHDFRHNISERRQYQRIALTFPMFWLPKSKPPVAGVGIELSGGGLQFLLQEEGSHGPASIAFQVHDRRIRAEVLVLGSSLDKYKGQFWQRYRSQFVGLLETDFDFILALTEGKAGQAGQPGQAGGAVPSLVDLAASERTQQPKTSVANTYSFELLPEDTRDRIVKTLIDMKRLPQGLRPGQVPMALHYAGTLPANGGRIFHRFSVRSRMSSAAGSHVFATNFLISDDGRKIIVRE